MMIKSGRPAGQPSGLEGEAPARWRAGRTFGAFVFAAAPACGCGRCRLCMSASLGSRPDERRPKQTNADRLGRNGKRHWHLHHFPFRGDRRAEAAAALACRAFVCSCRPWNSIPMRLSFKLSLLLRLGHQGGSGFDAEPDGDERDANKWPDAGPGSLAGVYF